MAFHLEGPWLNTTGKKKGKVKFASAEAKRQHIALEEEWQKKNVEWAKLSKPVKQVKAKPAVVTASNTPAPHKSLNLWVTGPVSSKPPQYYTGTKMKGISTLHKSNAVPVFSDEEIIDIATMRRG